MDLFSKIIIFLFTPLFASAVSSGYFQLRIFQENKRPAPSLIESYRQVTSFPDSQNQICSSTLQRADLCLKRFTNALLRNRYGSLINMRFLNETLRNFIGMIVLACSPFQISSIAS